MMTATLSARSPLHNDRVSPPHAVVRHSALGSEQLGASDSLLHHHARDGNHREAAVVELLGLHLLELRRVDRLEAERVEAVVARRVVLLDGPALDVRVLERREDREDLDDGDSEDDDGPEGLERRLLESVERAAIDLAAEERVEGLGERVAESGQHGNPAVLDLDLAVEADLALGRSALLVAVGAEASRVEEAQRRRDARKRLCKLRRVERRVRHRHGVLNHREDGRHPLLHDHGTGGGTQRRHRAGERERR
mmetsp:Transcript_14759/g.33910  ORF Transcript_14759/g.33910 Transcript_14759/m.33910 type:complete len:252 (+) Transcript_14759:204-959(+)